MKRHILKVIRSMFLPVFILILMPNNAHTLQWPAPSSVITAGYGWRIHPTDVDLDMPSIAIGSSLIFKSVPEWHNGIDIRANYDKLKAVSSGAIQFIRTDAAHGGNRIKVAGWNYLHLSNSISPSWEFDTDKRGKNYFAIQVNGVKKYYSNAPAPLELKSGQTVTNVESNIVEGDIFAISGTAGTGPHLHLMNYNGGDPTKSPLIDLYSANTGTDYNPPHNLNDPIVTDLTYDDVTGIITGKTDATSEHDINRFRLSISDGISHEISFYKRINATKDHLSDGTKTGIRPEDKDAQKHSIFYKWKTGMCGIPGNLSGGPLVVNLDAFDVQDKKGSKSITIGLVPSPSCPGGDHPDDNYSVSDPTDLPPDEEYTGEPIWIMPRIGIFKDGFVPVMGDLLTSEHIRYTFKTIDVSSFDLANTDLIVIPSGGLHALWNTDFFKKGLDDYVKAGGKIVVFAQQHGYEYSALPTPDGNPVAGYGWTEDQSCQYRSSYIDTWHQMLSSLDQSTPSINVDGYFTSYPSNATVLLRRTANGQPAAIMYPHGQGYVIVTTFYSDVASGMSQASDEEKALIRDIITWAKKPETLAETRPGGTISIPVSVTNSSSTDAAGVKISIYDPDRKNVLKEETIAETVPAGSSAQLSIEYSTSGVAALGIYHVDYSLLDEQDEPIWPRVEMDAARLAVSKPPANPYTTAGLRYAINSPSEEVFKGQDVAYTVTIWNNSDQDRRLRLWKALNHCEDQAFLEELTVPANDSVSRTFTQNMFSNQANSTIWVTIYEENAEPSPLAWWLCNSDTSGFGYTRSVYKAFKLLYNPSVSLSMSTVKTVYKRGETVNFSTNLQNKQSLGYSGTVKVRVTDPVNAAVYTDTFDITLAPYGGTTVDTNFTLPPTAQTGFYSISAEAFDTAGKKIGGTSSSFELPRSKVAVKSNLPTALAAGANAISFTLSNTGKIDVSSGTIDITLKDPDGAVAYSGSQPFTLAAGENKTLDVPVTIPSLKLGNYILAYSQSDETRTGKPVTATMANTAGIALSLDKAFYRVRETANLSVSISNTGKFDQDDVTISVSVPDTGYADSRTTSIRQGQVLPLQFSIPISETLAAGQHAIDVTLTMSSGSSAVRSTKLTIPESALTVAYAGPDSLAAGDTIHVTVENTGGVDTTFGTQELTITDKGQNIYQGSVTGAVLAGERKTLTDIEIPSQIVKGPVRLNVQVNDSGTGKPSQMSKMLEIEGLTATLLAQSDKDFYLNTEPVTGSSSILNGQYGIEGGSLKVAVTGISAGAGEFSHFLPKTGWIGIEGPQNIAIASDGTLYVVAKGDYGGTYFERSDSNGNFTLKWMSRGSYYYQFYADFNGIATAPDGTIYAIGYEGPYQDYFSILKFDSNGNFIEAWGSPGNGDGQFYYPADIAVASDGSVYVADTYNNRIQKFDGDGNFIAKWGSYGTGSGQFNRPTGIAVAPDGSVYVTERLNHRVQKFDADGNFVAGWGSFGSGNGQFRYPWAIAVSPDGFLYVADTLNKRIQKFDSNGNFITIWGDFSGGDIAVASDGSVYVIDNKQIQKFDSNGNFLAKWSNYGSDNGEFYRPANLATTPDGTLYVTETENNRIQKFDSKGNFLVKWGSRGSGNGQFNGPNGIAAGSDGFVYVADSNNNRIQKFDGYGNFITTWGSYGSGNGQFQWPMAVAVASDGSVYVADSGNNRIQKFDSNGNFLEKWGSYCQTDTNRDGIPDQECKGDFYQPRGVAVGSDGFVYVADFNNNRIQKFDSIGNYVTEWKNLSYPWSVAVDASGTFYVSEWGNRQVQKFDSNGNFLAKWSGAGSGTGIAVSSSGGTIYAADTFNNRIQRMVVSNTVFETTIPINQPADVVENHTTAIGVLDTAGKYFLQEELKNTLGQTIARSDQPFYVVSGNTVLLYSTDKKYYRPNETVTITGEVRNLASIEAVDQNTEVGRQMADGTAETLYSETFSIPAGGAHPFTFTTTAGAEGTVALVGKVTQNNSTLVEIKDQYEVASPSLSATVSAPEVVGNEPFTMNVELKNEGKVAANAECGVRSAEFENIQQVTLLPGETKLLQYAPRITSTSVFTFTFSGDLSQTVTKNVAYGLAAEIQLGVQGSGSGVKPEGRIEVPVRIVNTGLLDESVTISYTLTKQADSVVEESKTYFIPKNSDISQLMSFDLTEGSYQLAALSSSPTASASAELSVLKDIDSEMSVAVGNQAEGLIPVEIDLTNTGYSPIDGSIRSTVVSSLGDELWSGEEILTQLKAGSSQHMTFNVNSESIPPGSYTIRAELLNNGGQQLKVQSSELTVQGAVFAITQMPQYQTFNAGEEASLTFKVRNTGNQEGDFALALKAYDLIDDTRTEWLGIGEEKEITFSFLLPEDLEEKDYFAEYQMTDIRAQKTEKGQVKYHLAGINIDVNATLDKQVYAVGDVARLTLTIVNQASDNQEQDLFARVNYLNHEEQKAFTLNGSQTLTFDIPLDEITGEKLFYGIYHAGGTSIHLNSTYIYRAGDSLTITTDKQVYDPGEVVAVGVRSQESGVSGQMTLTGPGGFSETFAFTGSASRSIPLPRTMTAGTYKIRAQITDAGGQTYDADHPIDVKGIQVKIVEAKLDKEKYSATDTIKAELTITSNTDLSGTLKTWIVDPAGKYTAAGTSGITLSAASPLLTIHNSELTTASLGIHRLVYGIYAAGAGGEGQDELLLSSGSEAFDVGEAVLLGITMDKAEYPTNTEKPIAKISLLGTTDAKLELLMDGDTIKTETLSLDGFVTLNSELTTAVQPGPHTLKAILTSGGLTSSKETSFVYGSSMPDLTVEVGTQVTSIGQDNKLQITATAMNQGKDASGATSVSLYDGESLFATMPVRALNGGAYETISFSWSVLGKAGRHTIKAVVDPADSVSEFNEQNNTSNTSVVVPDLAVTTATDKDTYKIRQKVYITTAITNLTASNAFGNLLLITKAKDASGNEVFTRSTFVGTLQPAAGTTTMDVWNTSGLTVDGVYTILQTVYAGSELVAQNTKLVALEMAPDFTLTTDVSSRRIKQGEQATYTASLAPINGWSHETSMSLDGLPAGTSVTFSPDKLLLPGQAETVVMTANSTAVGSHTLYLTAQGVDEGEIVSHTVPLTLDVSGFGLESATASQTVMQLKTATFPISLVALNGYEGSVNLSVSGLPHGTKASLDNTQLTAPGTVNLLLLTSKYAKPGTYTITLTGNDGLVTHSLNLSLVLKPNPAIAAGILTTPGPGPQNEAVARLYDSGLQLAKEFTAFNAKYGASAISADIDGDGFDEIIVAKGPDSKNNASFKVFNREGSLVTEYTAFDAEYGLTLASADLDGDWTDEIIVGMGPDPKNPAVLKVLKYTDSGFTTVMTYTVDSRGSYGLNVATGDIDGDGVPEIITAPGPGPNNPATVTVWKYSENALMLLNTFTAFDGPYGVNIAVGDTNGDGTAEIVTGAGADPKNAAMVRVYQGDGTLIKEFTAYDTKHSYGVDVSAADIDADGTDEIITGPGPGPQNEAAVKVFKADGTEKKHFRAYPDDVRYGVKVSGCR